MLLKKNLIVYTVYKILSQDKVNVIILSFSQSFRLACHFVQLTFLSDC